MRMPNSGPFHPTDAVLEEKYLTRADADQACTGVLDLTTAHGRAITDMQRDIEVLKKCLIFMVFTVCMLAMLMLVLFG